MVVSGVNRKTNLARRPGRAKTLRGCVLNPTGTTHTPHPILTPKRTDPPDTTVRMHRKKSKAE